MAEPSPSDDAKGTGRKPSLVAVGGDAQAAPIARVEPAAATPERPRTALLLIALVAALATVAVLVQTQRLQETAARAEGLAEQVIGLEAQLAAAHTQIATYEMQRGQIREAVSDLSQRVLLLGELVGSETPLLPPEEAP